MSTSFPAIPDQPLEARPLLEALIEGGVDFVVVGGIAGLAHGSTYPSFDLDVAYARDRPNLERVAAVLPKLEVTLANAPADLPFQLDVAMLENGANFTFDTKHGRFDILGHLPGVRSYEELRSSAWRSEIEGVSVLVASLDHLIAMKRASDRAKDRIMLEEYIAIADEQRGAGQAEAPDRE